MSIISEHTTLWSNIVRPDGTSPYIPGTVHLRIHPAGSERTRICDLAGVSMWAADEHIPTTFLAANGQHGYDFATTAGRGWRDRFLHTEITNGLLDATAAIYRLWTRTAALDAAELGAASCMIVIENLSSMTNGALNNDVDDTTNMEWLEAVRCSGLVAAAVTLEKLRRLTGLDFEFHQGELPEQLPETCIVAAVDPRRFHTVGDMGSVRGSRFIQMAETVVEYHSVRPDPASHNVTAEVKVLKHRTQRNGTVTVTRPLARGCWMGPTGR